MSEQQGGYNDGLWMQRTQTYKGQVTMVKRARSYHKFWEYTTDVVDENGRRKTGRRYGELARSEPLARWYKNIWYMNGELVRKLRENRNSNTARIWIYDRQIEVDVPLNTFIKYRKQAFTSYEAAYLLRLSRANFYIRWKEAVGLGVVAQPKGMDKKGIYHSSPIGKLYNEEDIYKFRNWYTSWRRSQRKDGRPDSLMPTETEIDAMIGNGMVLYTENLEGEKIPIWKETSY